ncbi:hypothetical protein Pcinc_043943 [Petrolisthes cinctipes]|uniref:Uncharacterized protein n=1 Tax=Petrolisthes cinctipes TaxID=88211 RepID=A0AAE1EHD5_PETCI|nr:hypothetical protein Pcinc_043943 [Petrolisthes cinctipes]
MSGEPGRREGEAVHVDDEFGDYDTRGKDRITKKTGGGAHISIDIKENVHNNVIPSLLTISSFIPPSPTSASTTHLTHRPPPAPPTHWYHNSHTFTQLPLVPPPHPSSPFTVTHPPISTPLPPIPIHPFTTHSPPLSAIPPPLHSTSSHPTFPIHRPYSAIERLLANTPDVWPSSHISLSDPPVHPKPSSSIPSLPLPSLRCQ